MKRAIFIIVLVIALTDGALAQGVRVVPQTTPQIFGCSPQLELIAPEKIELSVGEEKTIRADVKTLRCIISHVRLDIEGSPLNFTQTPEFYTSILPNKTGSFNLTFFVNKKLENQTYGGQYFIKTNEGGFGKHAVDIIIREAAAQEQKPIATPLAQEEKSAEEVSESAQPTLPIRTDLLLILIIVLIGIAYFVVKKR